MGSNSFHLKAVLYAIFIGLCAFGFVWTLQRENILVTRAAFFILWGLGIYLLYRLTTQYQKDVQLFIDAVAYKDDVMIFDKKGKENFQPLYQSLNTILEQVKHDKVQFEIQKQYFEYTVENVAAGVIALNEYEEIEVFNLASYLLLGFRKRPSSLSDIERKLPNISSFLKEIAPNQQAVFQYIQGLNNTQLLFQHGLFKLEGKTIRLYTFQNIQPELATQEVKSWQKLIKTLRHEIINSLSPVTLLSSGLLKTLDFDLAFSKQSPKLAEEMQAGLKAINKRSKGLQEFVSAFKNISDLSKINKQNFPLKPLLEEVKVLSEVKVSEKGKPCKVNLLCEDIIVYADSKLLEQVIINLVKNAKEAPNRHTECLVKIEVSQSSNKISLLISDNGTGITDELKKHVFIPFFTNKEKGSGIGLAFAKMVMQAHGGQIELIDLQNNNTEYAGASFRLTIPRMIS